MIPGRLAFIIGTGRCGTTMLAQILNAHSRICVPHELQLVFEYGGNGPRLYDLFKAGETREWLAADFIRKIGELSPHRFEKFFDYEHFFRDRAYPIEDLGGLLSDLYSAVAASRGKDIFLEQTPWYGQRLDIMKELFPRAKFIHMVRDGRDVALSFARTPWWHDSPAENLERWQQEVSKIADDAALLLDDAQYLEVRYEDFALDTPTKVREITDFLGVKFEEAMLLPENMIDYAAFRKFDGSGISSRAFNNWQARKERAVFTDNVFGWKKTDHETFTAISQAARSTLARFGYEA